MSLHPASLRSELGDPTTLVNSLSTSFFHCWNISLSRISPNVILRLFTVPTPLITIEEDDMLQEDAQISPPRLSPSSASWSNASRGGDPARMFIARSDGDRPVCGDFGDFDNRGDIEPEFVRFRGAVILRTTTGAFSFSSLGGEEEEDDESVVSSPSRNCEYFLLLR